jgi:hypothetical protein
VWRAAEKQKEGFGGKRASYKQATTSVVVKDCKTNSDFRLKTPGIRLQNRLFQLQFPLFHLQDSRNADAKPNFARVFPENADANRDLQPESTALPLSPISEHYENSTFAN